MHLLLNFVSIIVLSFAILLCAALWYYKKFIAPYNEFPTVSILKILKLLLTEKIPKNVTATSYYFQKINELCKEYLPEGLCFIWLLHPYLIIFDEEAVKVLGNEKSALNKTKDHKTFYELVGNGLIVSNVDLWRKRRKMFNPAFSVSILKDTVSIINRNATTLVKQLMEVQEEPVDITKHVKFCAILNICESIIGLDVKERRDEVERFAELVSESGNLIISRILQPHLHPKYILPFFSEGRQFLKTMKETREFTAKLLQEMKESVQIDKNQINLEEANKFLSKPHKSFAQLLVEHHLEDPSFTFESMLDELTSFVLAGYDTVSCAMMWCLFMLGLHQDVQEHVCNELESVPGDDLSYHDLLKLTYMDCVIQETLRLYPPVPIYPRELEKNVQCGKYNIPKGTSIVFFQYLYHRNPKIYPDPEKFDPERFLDGNSEKRPWIHIPFGLGMRNCIGKKFALLEMKITLAHILRNFKVTSLDRREDIDFRWEIVLTTVKPLNIRLTPRQQIESQR